MNWNRRHPGPVIFTHQIDIPGIDVNRIEKLIKEYEELRRRFFGEPHLIIIKGGGWLSVSTRTGHERNVRPVWLEEQIADLKARVALQQRLRAEADRESAERLYWECRGVTTGVPSVPAQYV